MLNDSHADRRQHHHRVVNLAIDEIIADDLPVDAEKVEALASSIGDVGLISPIAVDADMRLRAGRKRLAAVQRLGWTHVPAVVLDEFERPEENQIVTIDENLIRFDLSPAQRSLLLWQRKQIYEEIYPETTAKKSQRQGRLRILGHPDAMPKRDTFVAFAAKAVAQPKSAIGYFIRFADWLGENALRQISGTPLDTFKELEALAEMPAEARDALIARAVAGEEVSARAEVAARGYRRPRTKYWRAKPAPASQPKKRGRPRKRPEAAPEPPAPEPTPTAVTPAPPDPNPVILAWRGASAFERRAFVRAARDELKAILRVLDAASAIPSPTFAVVARAQR